MSETPRATLRRRIQWFDTDASTKYHNTAPLRLMEEAEALLLDRLGLVRDLYGWLPRAHVSVDYRRPLRFWDEVDVEVSVERVGGASIEYAFSIRTTSGELSAEGRVVAVLIDGEGKPRPWSDEHRALLDGTRRP